MRRWILTAVLCLALSGCAAWQSNDYLSITPHSGAETQTASTDAVTVENYQELKSAILSFVREGQPNGTIHVTNYDGDVETELSEAAYEVAKLEPLGAYAVDYMTHDCARIVSYYEIHINITFRRTAQEIAAIQPVATTEQLVTLLTQAVDDYESRLTVRMSSYQEQDIPAIVAEYCAQNPGTVMEAPTVTVSAYPESGSVRILEIDFGYTETARALQEKAQAVEKSVAAAAEYIRYRETDRGKAELLFTYLMERFSYTAGGDDVTTPLYDALCSGVATPEGLSQAWQLISDQAGVTCYTVQGLRSNEAYTWNIISADGYYRHLDLYRCMVETGALALLTDQEMGAYYWNAEAYPACEPEPQEPVIVQEPEPTDPEPPQEPEPSQEPEPEPDETPSQAETTT